MFYSVLKGLVRLLQGLEQAIASADHSVRLILLEDAEVALKLPSCGAKCIAADGINTIFTQMSKSYQLSGGIGGATSTIVTVMAISGFSSSTVTDVLAAVLAEEIWKTMDRLVNSKEVPVFIDNMFPHLLYKFIDNPNGPVTNRLTVQIPSHLTVFATLNNDTIPIDLRCFLRQLWSGNYKKKSICETNPYYIYYVNYALFHWLYHKFGVMWNIQGELLAAIPDSR